jgi:hypothetical protein
VPGNFHGYLFLNTGSDHVPNASASKVME